MVSTRHTRPGLYAIRVQGHLTPRWSTWFDGFEITTAPDGTSIISGTVVDQAALHGLLQSLRDLGLPLISVTPQDDTTAPDGRSDAVLAQQPPPVPDPRPSSTDPSRTS